jgi:hypothetical protein
MRLFYSAFLLVLSLNALALEVDEKLTLRILKVSSSKKTILINRGVEDGLEKDNHAKFYLTTGVVARGVVVKVSPSRSIWSLYRVVNGKKVQPDMVMNLKISSPIKVSGDPTKVVYRPIRPIGPDVKETGIQLADGAEDLDDLTTDEENDLNSLEADAYIPLKQRPWDFFGILELGALRSRAYGAQEGNSTTTLDNESENSQWGIMLGVERYFEDTDMWWEWFSIAPFFHYQRFDRVSLRGFEIETSLYEFGVGVNWHFFNKPHDVDSIIFYLNWAFGGGQIEEYSFGANSNGTQSEVFYDGGQFFTSFGVGGKYFLKEGFGLRGWFDFLYRQEEYDADDDAISYSRTTYGLRFFVGLSYRW